jgi:hypothetical protein
MSVTTYEGIVEDGRIKLTEGVQIPESTRVYVIIPDAGDQTEPYRVSNPRLASPADSSDFVMQIEETPDTSRQRS